MFSEGRACLDLAQQLHAVEKAIGEAKRTLIHDHVDSCLDVAANGGSSKSTKNVLAEFKAISRYLCAAADIGIFGENRMSLQPIILVVMFAVGVAAAVWAPGVSDTVRKAVGLGPETSRAETKAGEASDRKPVLQMNDERIALARIEQAKAGPAKLSISHAAE
jgi:DNA-binding FrmR family transcriptional regulator